MPPQLSIAGAPLIRRGGALHAPTQPSRGHGGKHQDLLLEYHHHWPSNPESAASIAAAKEQRLTEHRQKRRQQIQSRFKTEMCKSYAQGVTCKFGETCSYAHCLEELRADEVHGDAINSPVTPHTPTTDQHYRLTNYYCHSTLDDVSSTCESYECHYGGYEDEEDCNMSTTDDGGSPPPSVYSYKPFIHHPIFTVTSSSSSHPQQHASNHSSPKGGLSGGGVCSGTAPHHFGGGWEETVDDCGITFDGRGSSIAAQSCDGVERRMTSVELGGGLRSPSPLPDPSRRWFTHNPYARF